MAAAIGMNRVVQKPSNFLFLLLIMLMLFALFAIAVQTAPHAIARHGDEALTARQCVERPEYIFRNLLTGRFALVCMTDAQKFGLVIIDEAGQEITAFLKNKMTSFEQVVKYLSNSGYELLP